MEFYRRELELETLEKIWVTVEKKGRIAVTRGRRRIGKTENYVLIIDEIQEFLTINPSIFSDIQELWDRYVS